jgi:hypothetical protein
VALKKEQQEWLERNTAKSQATGRKVRSFTDVASTALGKEEMAVRL